MRFFVLIAVILTLSSCNVGAEKDDTDETVITERSELSRDSKIFYGNRLFSEKTCITCHLLDKENVGPPVVEIMAAYKERNGDIGQFLRGKSKPIVDTTASQVAIMQDNINGFLQEVTDEELDAITTYMLHVAELDNR